MYKKKFAGVACAIAIIGMSMTGCSSGSASDKIVENTYASETDASVSTGSDAALLEADTDSENSNGGTEEAVLSVNAEVYGDLFTERDLENDYDAEKAVKIKLTGASAEGAAEGVSISDAAITISKKGVYVLTGTLDNGMIIVDVEDTEKVQLVLDNVTINNDSSAAIYVRQADKVFITTAEASKNTLSGGKEYKAIDENNIDATIFSKSDITLNGLGELNISSETGHAVVSKDDLKVTGGNITVNAGDHGLSGKDSVSIAQGVIDITCKQDGIHSENDDDSEKGNVNIMGGSLTINAGDDGVHAGNVLTVASGSIDIKKSYEGLEGLKINISDGDIKLVASDDGLNAAGGNDSSGLANDDKNWGKGGMDTQENAEINITGGKIYVNAGGDGIDSNGYLTVSGGEIYVDGPTNSGNGALDYGISAKITGGTIVAVGASGMAEGFTTAENQGAILTVVDNASENTLITLLDQNGKELFSWTAAKTFNSVVISTPDIQQGQTYTLKTGDCTTEITMDSLTYQNNPGGTGGFGGHGGGGGGHQKPDFNNGDGTSPQMPDGNTDGTFPQMPDGNTDGTFPQMPDGNTDGTIPQKPDGDDRFHQKQDGNFGDMPDKDDNAPEMTDGNGPV